MEPGIFRHSLMKNNTDIPMNNPVGDRDEVRYLLGNPPSWMMRYGISVVAGVFLVLLALSYLIRYPDVVKTPVILTTANPPIRIMAKSDGRIAELLVADKQPVQSGQILAVLENTARWRDVLMLESWLGSPAAKPDLPEGLQAGELQGEYSVFSQHWRDLQYFEKYNGVADRVAYLRRQMAGLEQIGDNFSRQVTTFRQEFALAEKEFRRQQQLHAGKLISDQALEAAESLFLAKKRQLETAESAVLENRLQNDRIESQIYDLSQGNSDHLNDKRLALAEDRQRLLSAIATWKNTFLIRAPIDGHIALSGVWSAHQPLNVGEEVLAVVPFSDTDGNDIIGRASIPSSMSGRVASGQRAIIRLDGYPARQHGIMETFITGMSLLPQQDGKEPGYMLDLNLPDTLVTSYGRRIPFRQEMSGELSVITEDRRVIDRIFDQLRDLLLNR